MNSSAPCRILFVDDEMRILKGLIRNLMSVEPSWECFCENSASDALAFLEKQTVDVIISDLRMPMMDGADFLQIVQKKHPQTVRFVLSGQASEELLYRASLPSHQYFTKPCEADVLVKAIHEAMKTTQALSNQKIKEIALRIEQFSSLPVLYNNLVDVLNKSDSNVEDVVKVVSQDPAMVSKIMKVANSAYFGAGGKVTNLQEGILFLGMEVLKGFVLVGKVFEKVAPENEASAFMKDLWFHSIQTGSFASEITRQYTNNKKMSDEALTAALLHDVGKLIFYEVFGKEYQDILHQSKEQDTALWQLEKSVYGNSHAEVGAYLLRLWGLPSVLYEAVEFHHTPYQASQKSYSVLTAVHIADVLEHDRAGREHSYTVGKLDIAYLQSLKLPDNLNHWKQMISNL